MSYTAADVQNILTSLAEDFMVDIEAVHNEQGYFIEYNTLAAALILGSPVWYGAIAEYTNEKLGLETLAAYAKMEQVALES